MRQIFQKPDSTHPCDQFYLCLELGIRPYFSYAAYLPCSLQLRTKMHYPSGVPSHPRRPRPSPCSVDRASLYPTNPSFESRAGTTTQLNSIPAAFPNAPHVCCMVNLGAGHPGIFGITQNGATLQELTAIVADCESVAETMSALCHDLDPFFFRLSVCRSPKACKRECLFRENRRFLDVSLRSLRRTCWKIKSRPNWTALLRLSSGAQRLANRGD